MPQCFFIILQALQRWKSDQTVEDVLKDYMKVILAGLAGGPTMIHCTLKAITRVYYVSYTIPCSIS